MRPDRLFANVMRAGKTRPKLRRKRPLCAAKEYIEKDFDALRPRAEDFQRPVERAYRSAIHRWHGARTLFALLMFLLALNPGPAQAHKVTVFAWVEGDTVFTQSKFAGGRQVKGGRLEVYDRAGAKLLEGHTDDQGRFAFKPPRPEALRIVLMAGGGHRGEWRVAAAEFSGTAKEPAPPAAAAASPAQESSAVETVTLSPADLQTMIEASLEKKLAPVLRRLEQQDQGHALSDIMGGIGYILGLVGLGAYIHSQRKRG